MFGVAILGFGVVGSGVAEVLTNNAQRIAKNAGAAITLKYIMDVRDFPDSAFRSLFIKDFSIVTNDEDIRVVVETIGGVGVAYEFTKRALASGKSVVTSNKELVAAHGCELIALAKENGVNYLFEASVGGGIPVLRPITQCLAANEITEIYGILNGTTNYILTQMADDKSGSLVMTAALADAQRLGYAEQNPASDIDGIDACRKICILSDLAFGRHVSPEWVPAAGISAVAPEDISAAKRLFNMTLKLIGRAVRREDGKISAYVEPHMISSDLLLAQVDGVMNGIVVRGNAIGDVMFYGAGAGKLPTASAVTADIIDAVKHDHTRKLISWDDGDISMMFSPSEIKSRWYVRFKPDGSGAAKHLGEILDRGADENTAETGQGGSETAAVTKIPYTLDELNQILGNCEVSARYRVLEDI